MTTGHTLECPECEHRVRVYASDLAPETYCSCGEMARMDVVLDEW